METPPPAGFYHNRGVHFIPFQIRDAHEKLWPAKYTQLILTSDPFVLAYRNGSNQQYGKPVHATPQFERNVSPVYNDGDLCFLDANGGFRDSVDTALMNMKDLTLIAEVHRFRAMCAGYEAKEKEVLQKVQELEAIGIDRKRCVVRLQMADAIERIEAERSEVGRGRQMGQELAEEREIGQRRAEQRQLRNRLHSFIRAGARS
jgi:hypothetical protein